MTVAGRLLREGDLPLRAVAECTGYTSEFAFARAFKREYGTAPGGYRRSRRPEPGARRPAAQDPGPPRRAAPNRGVLPD